MRPLTTSNAYRPISGINYLKIAELLFIALLLCFIYPFFLIISGIDPTIPLEAQSEMKAVYFLQMALPFLCLAIASRYRGPGLSLFLPSEIVLYLIICFASTIWSVDPYDTFKFTSVFFLYILSVSAICHVLNVEVICKIIIKVLIF